MMYYAHVRGDFRADAMLRCRTLSTLPGGYLDANAAIATAMLGTKMLMLIDAYDVDG